MVHIARNLKIKVARAEKDMTQKISVVGAGFAGSEAAWQIAQRGIKVDLYEMRPQKETGAHKTDKLAEFVLHFL